MAQELVAIGKGTGLAIPAIFAPDARATERTIEFFTEQIRNPNTRKAYARAASSKWRNKWPTTNPPAPRASTPAVTIRSPSMRSNEFRFETGCGDTKKAKATWDFSLATFGPTARCRRVHYTIYRGTPQFNSLSNFAGFVAVQIAVCRMFRCTE